MFLEKREYDYFFHVPPLSLSLSISPSIHAQTQSLRYKWLKDSKPLRPSSHVIIEKGKLTIKDTTSKDSANYTCVADNGLDSDSASGVLRVRGNTPILWRLSPTLQHLSFNSRNEEKNEFLKFLSSNNSFMFKCVIVFF